MSPSEHDILKRQVDDLLKWGYIKESLGPCAIPALHTPKKDGCCWCTCVDSHAISFSKSSVGRNVKYDGWSHYLFKTWSSQLLPPNPYPTSTWMEDNILKTKDGLYEWLAIRSLQYSKHLYVCDELAIMSISQRFIINFISFMAHWQYETRRI